MHTGAVPLSHVPLRWLRVHGLRRVLGGDCDADGVRSQRASVAPRGGPFAQRGSTGFPGAVIPTCRPMLDTSARRRRSERCLVPCPPGSEGDVLVLSQIPQRPRGLPGDPPDVGALRGPTSGRCSDVRSRLCRATSEIGTWEPWPYSGDLDRSATGIRSHNRAAWGARVGGPPRSPSAPRGARLCVLETGRAELLVELRAVARPGGANMFAFRRTHPRGCGRIAMWPCPQAAARRTTARVRGRPGPGAPSCWPHQRCCSARGPTCWPPGWRPCSPCSAAQHGGVATS